MSFAVEDGFNTEVHQIESAEPLHGLVDQVMVLKDRAQPKGDQDRDREHAEAISKDRGYRCSPSKGDGPGNRKEHAGARSQDDG